MREQIAVLKSFKQCYSQFILLPLTEKKNKEDSMKLREIFNDRNYTNNVITARSSYGVGIKRCVCAIIVSQVQLREIYSASKSQCARVPAINAGVIRNRRNFDHLAPTCTSLLWKIKIE